MNVHSRRQAPQGETAVRPPGARLGNPNGKR